MAFHRTNLRMKKGICLQIMLNLGIYVVISILASPYHLLLIYVKYISIGLNFAEKNVWGLRPPRVPKLGTIPIK